MTRADLLFRRGRRKEIPQFRDARHHHAFFDPPCFDAVSLDCRREIHAIVGRNGAGKSTMRGRKRRKKGKGERERKKKGKGGERFSRSCLVNSG